MAQPVPFPPPGFDELSVDEKVTYLQSLRDRITATPETVPVPGSQQRSAYFDSPLRRPADVKNWAVVYFFIHVSMIFSARVPGPVGLTVSTVSVLASADSVPVDVPSG
jgi:hypothetical protein